MTEEPGMLLAQSVRESFERSFGMYDDFLATLDEESLRSKLPDLPSNTIGLQLWCVVGARESYARAIVADVWSGFACSLEEPANRTAVAEALRSSADVVRDALSAIDSCSAAQSRLALDLLEHEAAHHGQLIRYLYGLRLPIPPSWQQRYALREL